MSHRSQNVSNNSNSYLMDVEECAQMNMSQCVVLTEKRIQINVSWKCLVAELDH